jgi:two-component system, HptB-dependent secretion and biofilm response regulator
VLIVDDDNLTRRLLSSLLKKLNFDAIEASTGEEGIEVYRQRVDDISFVFLDLMLPGIQGDEVALAIKRCAGARFVPIVFITGAENEASLVACMEAGGDDFITKPFRVPLLRAKIRAVQQLQALYQRLQLQHDLLAREEELAERVFTRVVHLENAIPDLFYILNRPAMTFSGDLLLVARSPSGVLHILMGDFTGHGLGAAIGAVPTSQIFHTMTRKGFHIQEIISEINRKLYQVTPTTMFLAAAFVAINFDARSIGVWNGGLPDLLLIPNDGRQILHRFTSAHLSLGIVSELDSCHLEQRMFNWGDQLILHTDGLNEANNANGDEFGSSGLEAALLNGPSAATPYDRICQALEQFSGDYPQDDDVTLLVVPCERSLIAQGEHHAPRDRRLPMTLIQGERDGDQTIIWQWQMRLGPSLLKRLDIVPVVLGQLDAIIPLSESRQELFMILSELYNNALDHGVLRLNSQIKSSPEGFSDYLQQREDRLEQLIDGYICLELQLLRRGESQQLIIVVEDSGPGFDYFALRPDLNENLGYAGRGLPLLRILCDSVIFEGRGNRVVVTYRLIAEG